MPIYRLGPALAFPPPEHTDESGILAVGGDLSPERLLLAYEHGIFPWFNDSDPVLWWCPEDRMVLVPERLKVSKSMKKTLKDGVFQVTFDRDFQSVIRACANTPRPGQDGTWINEEMIEAYSKLHNYGYAHSVESWFQGELVGGLYGVSLGKAFFGESMFSHRSEASKVALYHLVQFAKQKEFHFIDCQVHTPHLESLGATTMPRTLFLEMLEEAVNYPDLRGKWSIDG